MFCVSAPELWVLRRIETSPIDSDLAVIAAKSRESVLKEGVLLSDLQKKTAAGIVNVFETGRVLGDYGAVSVLPGDTGHLSYGRSQVTLGSGNLYRMIQLYCSTPRAAFPELSSYLPRMQQRDFALDTDMTLRTVLQQAGQDPVMHTVQDQFFDANYWSPAAQAAANFGISSALGTSVVYDSHVQGAWGTVRDLTTAQSGAPGVIGENDWVGQYVNVRRGWLANNPNPALHPTVYRMDCFLSLIQDSSWDLPLPLSIRGVAIDEDTLVSQAPVRILSRTVPPITGDDVRAVQRALIAAGADLTVDGVFGPQTQAAVQQFQQQQGLAADGIVDPATRSALGI